jgi:hypothetical protein
MTNTELLNYQIEYEEGGISIDELCSKYNVKRKQLKGYTKWQQPQEHSTPVEVIVPDQPSLPSQPTHHLDIIVPEDSLLNDINIFKKRAVKYALESIQDAQYLEVKEFKDLVSIVDTVEKSVKGNTQSETTVNVMINNMMAGLKDDC